ncbi:MAG: hypothetical protein KAT48_14560 [Bacteroidales bacterium]|nr:hypothetical protein [Bacteroidales bacterium]
MAKCPICNSRKGKRHCLIADSPVCSLCCGSTRNPDLCLECQYYQKPKRRYNDVPAYAISEMDRNMDLESYGNAIEGALCSYDTENGNNLKDSDAIRIIELLIDTHYFRDQQVDTDIQLIANGVNYVKEAIRKDLHDVSNEVIVKILGVIRFVAKRRTKMGKEYMNIIHQYVGQRIDTGIRILRQ